MIKRVAIVLCFFSSCTTTGFRTEQEMIDFVQNPDHDLKKIGKIGSVDITVLYKPADLLVAQELRRQPGSKERLKELREKYSSNYYFLISLSSEGNEVLNTRQGMDRYSDLVQTMSFRMNEYVTLTTNASDTIPVSDFILNRTFNMSKTTDLLFVFNKEKAVGKEWVQINLNEFGLLIGDHRFRFQKKDLDNIPAINFETVPHS